MRSRKRLDILDKRGRKSKLNVQIIPNGICTDKFTPCEKEKRILMCSRILKFKGFQYAIEALQGRLRVPISIDTCKAMVARRALESGVHIINDISAGSFDEEMAATAAEFDAGVVAMHIQGTPRTMQKNPRYHNLIDDVRQFFIEAVSRFKQAGVSRDCILVDPGIGFGKNLQHNLELIRRCGEFQDIAAGVLVGPSRKSFLGMLTNNPVESRRESTVASVVCAVIYGADVVRVHDVAAVRDALKVADAVKDIYSCDKEDV